MMLRKKFVRVGSHTRTTVKDDGDYKHIQTIKVRGHIRRQKEGHNGN